MARLAEQCAASDGLTGPEGPEGPEVKFQARGIVVCYDCLFPGKTARKKSGIDSMTDQLRDRAAERREEIINWMQSELELTLTFVNVSSIAYRRGNLQLAIDAHSRAEALHTRAIAELIESVTPES